MKNYYLLTLLLLVFAQNITAQQSNLFTLTKGKTTTVKSGFVYDLPFVEDWESGGFTQNLWNVSDNSWAVKNYIGNGGACAQFEGSPTLINYSSTLTSKWLAGHDLHIGKVILKFDLKLVNFTSSATEVLYIKLFDGLDYMIVDSIKNLQSFDWTTYSYEISNVVFGNDFKIVFEAAGDNSSNIMGWNLDNIEIYRECGAPRNLDGYGVFVSPAEKQAVDNTEEEMYAVVNWEIPECLMPADSCEYYGSGDNAHGVGLSNGGDMRVAIRWDARSLNRRDGDTIKKMYYYLRGNHFDNLIIHIWTGHNGENTIYTDTVEMPVMFEWGEHVLKEAVVFHSTLEYWAGYDLINVGSAVNIAGTDEGPAVKGYGDKISTDHGITWNNISDFELDYNWNIKLLFSGNKPADSLLESFVVYKSNIDPDSVVPFDTVKYNHGITSFNYNDYDVENHNTYYYKVNTLWLSEYDTCNSVFAKNTVHPAYGDYVKIMFPPQGVTEHQWVNIKLYPNPAKEMITVSSEFPVNRIVILDMLGRNLKSYQVLNKNQVRLTVSELGRGTYIVKVLTEKGLSYGKIVVR